MQRLKHDMQRVTSVPGFNTSAAGVNDLIDILNQYKKELEDDAANDYTEAHIHKIRLVTGKRNQYVLKLKQAEDEYHARKEQARRRASSMDFTVGRNSTNLVDYSHGRHHMPSYRRHDSSDEENYSMDGTNGDGNRAGPSNPDRGNRTGPSSSDRVRMRAGRNRVTKTRRYRPGQKALEEIRKYQESEDLLIPKAPFARLVREIMQTSTPFSSDLRIRSDAINALQEASEALLVQMFDGSSLISAHSKRATLTTTDVQLYRRLCLPNL